MALTVYWPIFYIRNNCYINDENCNVTITNIMFNSQQANFKEIDNHIIKAV